MSLLDHTPVFSQDVASQLASDLFGIDLSAIQPLPSERDQNFRVTDSAGQQFVFKISNALEQRELLVAQNEMMRRVTQATGRDPRIVPSIQGNAIEVVNGANGSPHFVRLVTFAEGSPLAQLKYHSPELMHRFGNTIGQLTNALVGMEDSSLRRTFHWDLAQALDVIERRIDLVRDEEQRAIIRQIVEQYESTTVPALADCPRSVIHGDANDGNVVVAKDGGIGVIDYGDAVFGWTIGDLAIAIAYAILEKPNPLQTANNILAGYIETRRISMPECTALYGLICIRLCVSVVMSAEQQAARPDDPYLTISQTPIRKTLPTLAAIPFTFAETTFRSTIGMEPNPAAARVRDWLSRPENEFAFPLAGLTRDSSRFHVFDLSVGSPILDSDDAAISEPRLRRTVEDTLLRNQSEVGVGRYLEPRLIYASNNFAASSLESERRTIHLGMDLFMAAGSRVCAPQAGHVEIVAVNDQPLDYGGLVILRHETADDDTFYSLYGHLSPQSIADLTVGQELQSGEAFATLGDATENGGWPPHLHFQLITDLCGLGADFPGVCAASWQLPWTVFCPDPNLVLRIPAAGLRFEEPEFDTTLKSRRERTPANLGLSYRRPIKMVRGWKHYLYNSSGRKFIDAYNNVPHVGHCHPEVVARTSAQLKLLNTNTRYLSDSFNEFTRRLTATMPDALTVCMLVNSASEANELALRMAWAKTRQRDLIVLEGAYHGHTTTLIDISPYKHDGPGGQGAPDWVHTAPVADCFRGLYRDEKTAGAQYAQSVHAIIARIESQSRGLSGFIAESCPSVGGQILFPQGYLADVYRRVRSAGGVCIADEVQTAYGRLGSVFYGFELQDVVPDIVVLGKPIGNGHPLAAVVTTREVADAFDTGMEYFSTYGGNNVSCAAGLAVLDVLAAENFQQNALEVGQYLLNGLRSLKEKYLLIGDVRGSGFFLGIELVRDRDTLEPAADEASFIKDRMRERGVLLGTDGPLHNVLKIRPPMTFSQQDATVLLEALELCIAEV